jgi:hypothetical protein
MSTALANFKRAYGVATHRLAGSGHRYPWMAFFATIKMNDGTHMGFAEVAAVYSMAALGARGQVNYGDTELEACQFLASYNGIPWPADEPEKRKANP